MRNVFSKWLKADDNFSNRQYDEVEHRYRSKFERDRDRILYSKAFRRLNGKTQVFLSSYSAHTRNRLTHTLEVSQISKAIAKQLDLDIDLTEAIALGHDLGHTPFGHVGERTLNKIISGELIEFDENIERSTFKHNLNGMYITNIYEKKKREYYGINITDFTIFGIIEHSSKRYKDEFGESKYNEELYKYYSKLEKECINKTSWTLEAFIVKIADEIAQRHHDIEDGLIAKIIKKEEIIELIDNNLYEYFNLEQKRRFKGILKEKDEGYFINEISSIVVDFLIIELINSSKERILDLIRGEDIRSREDFHYNKKKLYDNSKKIINFSNEVQIVDSKIQKFLMNRILSSYEVQSLDGKGEYIIKKLFKAYWTNPKQLPNGALIRTYIDYNSKYNLKSVDQSTLGIIRKELEDERKYDDFNQILLRGIINHISTMTDDFAYKEFDRLYGTKI